MLFHNTTNVSRYVINATVSDGHFSETISVKVKVEMATEEMVQNAVTLRFQDLSPEDFFDIYLKHVMRALQNALVGAGVAQTPEPMHIIGVQLVAQSSQLEVLLAVEGQEGGYLGPGELALRLSELREKLGGTLQLMEVLDQSCSGELECGDNMCELTLKPEPVDLITYGTSKVSFVVPRFQRTETCTCSGRSSPRLHSKPNIKSTDTKIFSKIFEPCYSTVMTVLYNNSNKEFN